MKGIYPYEYLANPNIQKPIEQIWDDINAYTGEFFEDEPDIKRMEIWVPIPPMYYKGTFIKGILFTQACDYIINKYPRIKDYFFVGAYTMCGAYSWSDKADLNFCCYENKQREEYYKNKYQKKKDIIFIPLQDADFTNEYVFIPKFETKKTVDLCCISNPYEVKNLPMLASAIKAYEEKYGVVLKTNLILGIRDCFKKRNGWIEKSSISPKSYQIMERIRGILGDDIKKYINFIPFVSHYELPYYYTSAKCTVLASLIEGKNRSLNESVSCNTPVVTFKQLNQYIRGGDLLFPPNSGEMAESFTAESFADAIHKVITNPDNYEPRKNYLLHNGRKNFVNTCLQRIPYYKEVIPDYNGDNIFENQWIDLAMVDNYQTSFHDFIYGKFMDISWVKDLNRIDFVLNYYQDLMNSRMDKTKDVGGV